MPCPIAAVSADGLIRAANTSWHQQFADDDQTGENQTRRYLPDLFPEANDAVRDVLHGVNSVSRRALVWVDGRRGAVTWWDLDLVPHPDEAGIVLVTARDVTDHVLSRREAEDAGEALKPIATRLHLAQEAAGIGTWEWDATADRQSWSPQQFRLHGLDPAVAVPPSFDEWIAMVHPDDRKQILAALDSGFHRGPDNRFQMEFRIHRADTQEQRWLLSFGRAVETAPDGRIARIVGVNIDITDRWNEQEALRKSEAMLRLASNAAGVWAWDWDLATDRVTWAEGLERALGLPPGGFGGTVEAFRALVHADDAPFVEALLGRALSGETPEYHAVFRMYRMDGTLRWTETRGTVVRDEQGRPVRVVGMDHDITELKNAEAALHQRERQQAAVLRLGQFALQEPSAQAVMDEAAQVLTETLGVEFAEVLERQQNGEELLLRAGVGWSSAYPVGQARVLAGLRSQAGYTLSLGSDPVIVADLSTEARFHSSAMLREHGVTSGLSVVVRGPGGNDRPWGVLGVHSRQYRPFTEHDIQFLKAVANLLTAAVQRASAEAELLERKARLRLFIERTPAAIAMFDIDMRYLAVSQRYVSDYGLAFDKPAELIGRSHYDIFEQLPDAWLDVHRRVLAGENLSAEDEIFVRPDGKTERVRWEMTPWHRADGAIGGALLFTEVLTARRQADAAIAESEERFRALAEAMPQLIYTATADGISEYKNQRWFDYSGQTPEQAHDGGWMAMLHQDDRDATVAAWNQAIASGQPYEREHLLRGRDGTYRWFLSRAVPLRTAEDGGIIRWLGTSTDISAIVEARETAARLSSILETKVAERTKALTEAAVELQAEMRRRQDMQASLLQSQKLEALGQLTAGVAHDFNNILTAIHGSFELIASRAQEPRVLSLVRSGKRAADRASSLTRQLLNFGRQETLQPTVLDVEQALHQASELIGHAVGASITRSVDIASGVWPVLTDGHQLEIALLNLSINARDAMPNGGRLIISARNLASAERPKTLPFSEYVSIDVRDSGQGMPPDVLSRALEPFFTTKGEGKGTGLGLAMVHAFALRSSGTVRIESREGIGTTVSIVLPRASVIGMDAGDASPPKSAATQRDRGATILVVDDDEPVRQITVGYLRDHGFNVIEAPNAEAAVVLSHSIEHLDLLLTDVSMPGADGPALAARLLAERPELPVLYITGSPGHEKLEAEHALIKPFAGSDLVRAIEHRLNRMHSASTGDGGLLRRLKHPALVSAYLFWRAARNGDRPPRLPDLDWGGLPDAEHAFTVAVEPGGESIGFRYLRVGRALLARLGRPLENSSVTAELQPNPDDKVLGSLAGAYRRCARTLSPSYEYAKYDFGDGAPVLFERLVLPVSDDGVQVTHLVGVALFSGDT